MTCDPYKEPITLLAAGELPEGERGQVERHLSECESCRREYEALQKLCDRIRSLGERDEQAEVPDGLTERLEERLAAAARKSLRPKARFGRWLAFAAAACVLIGLAVWLIAAAEQRDARAWHEQATAHSITPTPSVAAEPADLPPASCIVYYRAWLKSLDALDDMLARDAAVLLRPERNLTEMDVRRFLETMNPIKEEHNEKHSMGSGAVSGTFV